VRGDDLADGTLPLPVVGHDGPLQGRPRALSQLAGNLAQFLARIGKDEQFDIAYCAQAIVEPGDRRA
jgi:hypothetical protein